MKIAVHSWKETLIYVQHTPGAGISLPAGQSRINLLLHSKRKRERKREEALLIREKREYCENLAFGTILSEQQWICLLEELRVKEDLNLTA